ncbi:MAG: hypothetical protein AAGK02_11385 [Pseudomonadota bacterium]
MEIQILQFAGSLAAILILAALAWALGLGGKANLSDADSVQRAANETLDGFRVVESAVDAQASAALAKDHAGRIMLVKRHGNRLAGRILGNKAHAAMEGGKMYVDCGEPYFGVVELDLIEPGPWADAINKLSFDSDA